MADNKIKKKKETNRQMIVLLMFWESCSLEKIGLYGEDSKNSKKRNKWQLKTNLVFWVITIHIVYTLESNWKVITQIFNRSSDSSENAHLFQKKKSLLFDY